MPSERSPELLGIEEVAPYSTTLFMQILTVPPRFDTNMIYYSRMMTTGMGIYENSDWSDIKSMNSLDIESSLQAIRISPTALHGTFLAAMIQPQLILSASLWDNKTTSASLPLVLAVIPFVSIRLYGI